MAQLSIKTGDQVMVFRGKDAGKKGKVMQVFPKQGKLVVEGVNSMTKNVRARRANEKGQRVQYFAPLDRSNVMLIDPHTGKPSRRRTAAMTAPKPEEKKAVEPTKSSTKKS